MKKVILTVIAATCAVGVFAQGTVAFNNRVTEGTTHVYIGGSAQLQGNSAADNVPGVTPTQTYGSGYVLLSGAGFLAQLLSANGAGQPESSLVPATPTTSFRTGAAAGNIALITATLTGVPLDAPAATLQMVAWDNRSGNYPTWAQASVAWLAGTIAAGKSSVFTVNNIGGALVNPPNIEPGLQSFNIYSVPEPSSFALAGLGAAALLIFRRRK